VTYAPKDATEATATVNHEAVARYDMDPPSWASFFSLSPPSNSLRQ
jgi:hypothetical protein